jgi:hypothetical protein
MGSDTTYSPNNINEGNRAMEKEREPQPIRCDYCGMEKTHAQSSISRTHCDPPFEFRRHSFTGAHPSNKADSTPRVPTIHDLIREKCELAQLYAIDGGFHSAARVLLQLSYDVEKHAQACDAAINEEGDER